MSILYYFAYGSNLHPLRLQNRVPSAEFLGLVPCSGYQLCFHKRHHEDNSGKCNMYQTNRDEDVVYGAVYQMRADEKPLLDQCEGEGYRCDVIDIELDDNIVECFVYIAEDSHINDTLTPHSWYQQIVLLGAQHHQLPDNYLNRIRQVTVQDDPDSIRHEVHQRLIDDMLNYSKTSKRD